MSKSGATGTGVIAAPATCMVDNVQYGTVYTFALGGKASPPAFVKYPTEGLLDGSNTAKDVPDGTALYVAACATCPECRGSTTAENVHNLGYVPREEMPNRKKLRVRRIVPRS